VSGEPLYRCVLEWQLSPVARLLVERLAARAEQVDALAAALPEKLAASRALCTAKPVKLSR